MHGLLKISTSCYFLHVSSMFIQYHHFPAQSHTSLLSINMNIKMKKLINARQYKDALDVFDCQSQRSDDVSLNLALKACTKLSNNERGIEIHKKLSSKSLQNRFIQASLVNFYSKIKHSLMLIRFEL